MCWRSEHANLITGDFTSPLTSFPSANLASRQHAYTVASCHVITSDYQGGTLPTGIGEPHYDRLILVIFNLGDALVGRRLPLGDALPWRRFLLATLVLGVSSPRRRLVLTLTPGVDFDLDFVTTRIRDGTEPEEVMPDASVGATPMEEDSSNESLAKNVQKGRPRPEDNIVERQIGGKVFKLGCFLSLEEREEVVAVISRHLDAFAWTAADMPGIDPDFLCHRLTMDAKVCPVRQRRRKFNEERCLVVKEETQKLLIAAQIREIQYPEWLANVVLVKKANGKWRMCVDFTDLNKACPKDSYPLRNIDALVDSASGYKMLSFLDAFSSYNQIKMHPRDESKTAFMTETCSYCYKVMPFGLKNAGATYQRLMDKVLAPMLGRNVQAYVDDMVVTSHESGQHVADLEELFTTISKYRLKLNPEKCVFGVEAGKFLGFMLIERGIEANPDKCATIIAMKSPTSVKEVQQLTGRMAALSRFVSAGGEKGHPYFQCLKRNSCFAWTDKCEAAFLKLKEYLATPPVL